ncbi:MAG: lipocalin family protein [Pseudomonadota bacterium]
MPPITTVTDVDLQRFSGDWYVIANIPTFVEKDAFNAIETYTLRDADTVDTTFTFRKGGPQGKRKTYTPVATVRPRTGNAVWGMQFIWPFKAEYRIIWLNPDYSVTIIGRSKRDYVWIMARSPQISPELRAQLDAFLAAEGYDLAKVQNVPQQWDD